MTDLDLPLTYWTSVFLVCIAGVVILKSTARSWAPAYAAVIGTVFAWYFIEPIYLPDEFLYFSRDTMELGYLSVSIFLVSFMAATPGIVHSFAPKGLSHLRQAPGDWSQGITVEKLALILFGLWLIIFIYGVSRIGGDVVGALFSTGGRSGTAVSMFARAGGANAGPDGFIVSTADYLYRLCLGAFGILLPIARKRTTVLFLLGMIVLTWPSAFLSGTRNLALSVVVPFFASFMLYSRAHRIVKVVVLGAGYFALEFVMRAMVAMRNDGFSDIDLSRIEHTKHLGLNMASELMHVTTFIQNGTLSLGFGERYLGQAANIIPRAIWPGKPLVGIDYAIVRGFGGAEGDLGIFATIASGLIGQGVLDFGNIVGPVIVGLLMAMWVGILNRVRLQGGLPRAGLFLIGLGLTFNLGREITLLVLYPFLFGYIGIRVLDALDSRRSAARARREEFRGPGAATSVERRYVSHPHGPFGTEPHR